MKKQSFINIKMLGLYDNFWVYIFPCLFSFFNVLIFQSFFSEVPESMLESARLDGAGEYRIYFSLVLPVSKPVFATIALFVAVYHWNSFYDSMLYTSSDSLQTIQLLMMKMIRNKEAAAVMASKFATSIVNTQSVVSVTIQFAAMIITVLPIVLIYPFLQRYFVKGMLIGSVKG